MRSSPLLLLVLFLLGYGTFLTAENGRTLAKQPGHGSNNSQQPQSSSNANQEAKVDFRSSTILVQIPVVVVDKNQAPVRNLSKDDFALFEGKKSPKIESFQELSSSRLQYAPIPKTPNTFTNELTRPEAPAGILVFLIDTVNSSFLDQSQGRRELIRYLANNLDSNQRVALVLMDSRGTKVLHDATQDPAELVQILRKLAGELPIEQDLAAVSESPTERLGADAARLGSLGPYSDLRNFVSGGDVNVARLQENRAIELTLHGLLGISWAVSGIQGRKSLIWLTGGFPFSIDADGAVPGGGLSTLYERALKATNDAEISIYPVDVRGLRSSSVDYSRAVRYPGWAGAFRPPTPFDTLREIAAMTGGQAFYNSNDLASCFQRASADAAHYYLLGYYLDSSNRRPGWRKLKVTVKRKDVEVRSRSGYFVTNATMNPDLTRKLDMTVALNSSFNSTGVPFTVRVNRSPEADTPTTNPTEKSDVDFSVRIAGDGIALATGENSRLDVDLIAVAFAPSGSEPSGSILQNIAMSIPKDQLSQLREQGVRYHNKLTLPSGHYTVRFVVRNNISGQVGSVSGAVVVP